MEIQLKNPELYPNKEVLENVLQEDYPLYTQFMEAITGPGLELSYTWNYYKDGKVWLCKVCHKKKTVLWLSVWEGFFKTSFYFTEKTIGGIAELDIASDLKKRASESRPTGRLICFPMDVNRENQGDILKIAAYKKSLK